MERQLSIIVALALVFLPVVTYADRRTDAEQAYNKHDYQKAIKLAKPLAEHGDAWAQFVIGEAYERGDEGLEHNPSKAEHWFHKSAAQGNTEGMKYLGKMFDGGWGGTINYEAATTWWQKAAEAGDAEAQNFMGRRYYFGHGVKQDYAQAYFWYSLAKANGLPRDPLSDKSAKQLTSQQLQSAGNRVKEWRAAFYTCKPQWQPDYEYLQKNYIDGSDEKKLIQDFTAHGYNLKSAGSEKSLVYSDVCLFRFCRPIRRVHWQSGPDGKIGHLGEVVASCGER